MRQGMRPMSIPQQDWMKWYFFYDPNLSWNNGSKITQEQWLVILKENGIEVSIATFKRYLNDRGFSKKRNKKSIISKPKKNQQLGLMMILFWKKLEMTIFVCRQTECSERLLGEYKAPMSLRENGQYDLA